MKKRAKLLMYLLAPLMFASVTACRPQQTKQQSKSQEYIERGNLFFDRRDYALAADCYTDAIKLDPDDAAVYVLRGDAYLADAAVKIFGDNEDYNERDFSRAAADYTQAIKLDPKHAIAYRNRGFARNFHLMIGSESSEDGDVSDFSQAILLDPDGARAYIMRAYVYFISEDYKRALADCNQAIKNDPNNAIAYVLRSVVTDDWQKSEDDLAMAEKLGFDLEIEDEAGNIAYMIADNLRSK
ncbi:MAG: hypothetical protein Pg6C_11190 [Treponemataceae bacterium]|nr:MAG: hypothetical protein Pg6C_11190 [Treponemataceae bacterium]